MYNANKINPEIPSERPLVVCAGSDEEHTPNQQGLDCNPITKGVIYRVRHQCFEQPVRSLVYEIFFECVRVDSFFASLLMRNKGKPASPLRRNEGTPTPLVGLLQLSELSCRLIHDFLLGDRGSDVEQSAMSPKILEMGLASVAMRSTPSNSVLLELRIL